GGVAHASYGGIGLALFSGFPPLLGALLAALIVGLILGVLKGRKYRNTDAVVSALWAMGMAFGIILTDKTPGYAADYLSYLFGNILITGRLELIASGAFAIVIIVLTLKYYRIILAVSADQDYAQSLGINVKAINLIILVLLCVGAVLIMKVSGLVMVMALLSIPVAVAERHTKSLSLTIILSGLISFAAIFLGFALSHKLNLTPSAVMVALLSAVYISDIIFSRYKKG
ncbi:MAG: metal ABC transporter permease, partial [Deferribacteraceae bacterium]|nr:metal ABC transporter permease [Deferribacteraceae bacterium]